MLLECKEDGCYGRIDTDFSDKAVYAIGPANVSVYACPVCSRLHFLTGHPLFQKRQKGFLKYGKIIFEK